MVSDTCYLYKSIDGYCPPDYYPTFRNQTDVNNFLNHLASNGVARGGVLKMAIDKNLGSVNVQIKADHSDGSIEELYDPAIVYIIQHDHYYIGPITSINRIADDVVNIKFNVDWYSSYLITKYKESNTYAGLSAKTVIYRRKSDGEFTYSDEGLVPVSTTITSSIVKATASADTFYIYDKDGNKVTYTAYSGNLFYKSLLTTAFYVVYNATSSNKLIKAIVVATPRHFDGGDLATNITAMLTTLNISEAYDPANLFFIGIIPLAPQFVIRGLKRNEASVFDSTLCYGTYTEDNLNHPLYSKDINLYVDTENICTYYNKLRIELGDGYSLYDVPFGKSLPLVTDINNKFTITPYLSSSLSAPLITFKISNSYYAESSTTITIPIYGVSIIADAEASYRAQERQYHQNMLSLQSQNELFSGIIGGFNQGAMISAFSRNQTSTGTSKGIVGGGIAIAGAIANYFYEDLYANKEATNILDKYNKCKPDVLAQDGSLIYELLCSNSGLKEYKYDAVTVTNVQTYQSKFGYATHSIGTDIVIHALTGYVQANVIMSNGIRKDVENYIKGMFNYGVNLSVIGGS